MTFIFIKNIYLWDMHYYMPIIVPSKKVEKHLKISTVLGLIFIEIHRAPLHSILQYIIILKFILPTFSPQIFKKISPNDFLYIE